MRRDVSPLLGKRQPLVPGLADEEALLIQLCEYLAFSGFLFADANPEEIGKGEQVINAFMEQEPEFLDQWVLEARMSNFSTYVQSQRWNQADMQRKIRVKLVKAFDQLAYGNSHAFNIRRNIHIGLMQIQNHPLQDFLLYLNSYQHFLLSEEDPTEFNQKMSIQDILKMRESIIERMEGNKFVDLLLKDIEIKRGGELPKTVTDVRKIGGSGGGGYQFFRPSQGEVAASSQSIGSGSIPTQDNGGEQGQQQTDRNSSTAQQTQNESKAILEIEDDLEDSWDDMDSREAAAEDDNEVIYGTGPIGRESSMNFIKDHPDSAIKFLFRRDLTEKHLAPEVLAIYEDWEKRGLSRGFVRKCLLSIMEWEKLPTDLTLLEITGDLKDKLYDLTHGFEQ